MMVSALLMRNRAALFYGARCLTAHRCRSRSWQQGVSQYSSTEQLRENTSVEQLTTARAALDKQKSTCVGTSARCVCAIDLGLRLMHPLFG